MYYPLLRWKAGEQRALDNAPEDWTREVCPIWFSDNYDSYLDLVLGVQSIWTGYQIIDLSRMELRSAPDELLNNLVESPVRFAIKFEDLDTINGAFREAFLLAPVFRVTVNSSCTALSVASHINIRTIIKSLSVAPVLIVDIGYIPEERQVNQHAMATIIDLLYEFGANEVVLTGGSFPISLDGLVGTHTLPRRELAFYQHTASEAKHPISYSDYCTLNPDWEDSGVLRSNHSAIKYTIDTDWLVIRQNGKDANALHGLARLLCLESEFKQRTAAFSWADDIWDKRGTTPPLTGPGNSTFHVSEFIHHHIAQVLKRG